jgi:hypothetical protein
LLRSTGISIGSARCAYQISELPLKSVKIEKFQGCFGQMLDAMLQRIIQAKRGLDNSTVSADFIHVIFFNRRLSVTLRVGLLCLIRGVS